MMNNGLQTFYKKHINWKFFNYLLDKTIKYQDLGCVVMLGICYDAGVKGKPMIYIKTDDYEQFLCGPTDVETTNFIYKVNITGYNVGFRDEDLKKDFIKYIEDKCVVQSDNTHVIYAIPK